MCGELYFVRMSSGFLIPDVLASGRRSFQYRIAVFMKECCINCFLYRIAGSSFVRLLDLPRVKLGQFGNFREINGMLVIDIIAANFLRIKYLVS